jgi:hypothetical protein
MTRPVHDIIITDDEGTEVGYYIYTGAETPIDIDLGKTNLAANVITESPGRQGGYYSVRDQDQPAIVYSDWTNGGGQKTYETEDSLSSRFHSSSYIDTQAKGELRLGKAVTLTEDEDVEGVIYGALDTVFCSFTPAEGEVANSVRYWDGTDWVALDITGEDPEAGVNCFATDGNFLYAAFNSGIYRISDANGNGNFDGESLASWSAEANVKAMVFSGGYMYAAKESTVGYLDSTPAFNQISPTDALGPTLTTYGLATANNWVYWGTTKGGVTKLYRVQYDGTNEWFEDVCSFPTGFVGAHMVGYLGNIYIGGYYQCTTEDAGQGVIYAIIDNTPTLLTLIGDNPDYAADPSSIDNDNRVWSLTPSGKDLYVLTTRKVLRWDLDDGGWVQVCDVPAGSTSSLAWATTGDLDYTGAAEPDSGTWTASGTGTPTIVSGTLQIATAAGDYYRYTAVPAGGDVLSNSTGTTMETVLTLWTTNGGIFGFDDGTYQTKVRMRAQNVRGTLQYYVGLGEWTGSAWDYSSETRVYPPVTLRLTCRDEWAGLYVNGTLVQTRTSLEDSDSTNVFFQGGWDEGGTTASQIRYDSLYISNDGAYAPGGEYDALTMGGIVVKDSVLYVGVNGAGYVMSDSTYETTGWLRQSDSSSKSGSLGKRYHTLKICHDPLRESESISADWYVDGNFMAGGEGTTDGTVTVFDVDESGHSFAPLITLNSDGSSTPILRSIIVTFDFEKPTTHTFILDCRKGAEKGRWGYDPETAVNHLINVGRTGGQFETHFAGTFRGSIQRVKFIEAQRSTKGFLEGIVQIAVREL